MGLTRLCFSSSSWLSSSTLNPLLMYIHVASQMDIFFSPAIFDISCVPMGGRGVSDACTYDVTWKTPQPSGCEKEPPVIYCAWSLPCRSASADTYGRSPFHLLLADCRGLLPRGRGGPGGPCCTVVVANSWVGRGAAGLHGGGSAGARAGSFQWQHRGAGDRLIKMFADGLGYGTHVCAWSHDAHPSQLAARERDADLAREQSAGWAAHGGQQGEEGPGAACWALGLPGTLQSGHQLGGLSAVPAAETGRPAVADQALSAAEERCPQGPARLGEGCLGRAASPLPVFPLYGAGLTPLCTQGL